MTASGPNPIPVTLGDNGIAWDVDLPPAVIGLYILHLLDHDFSAIEGTVLSSLGIDRVSRRRSDTTLAFGTHAYRWRNNALAMELLVALLLTRLDSPRCVKSLCQTRNGWPYSFAPRDFADITACYTVSSARQTLRVVVEASAMRYVTAEDFDTQLDQALKHTRKLRETNDDPFYALVINDARVGSDKGIHRQYRNFLRRERISADPMIRLIAMDAKDLALALCDLAVKLPADRFRFGADQLRDVLDVLYDGLGQASPNPKPDWMRDAWSDIVARGATPLLPLQQHPEDN